MTFTTLGYGDFAPQDSYRIVAVTEAFLGAFCMALFLIVFARKIMR